MSSLPRENLDDILLPLDRWTLDAVQFTNRRFRHLIAEHMSDVCLRNIESADFYAPTKECEGRILVEPVGRQKRAETHEDFAGLFSAFLKFLQSSRVARLYLLGIDFTPALAKLVLDVPIVALDLVYGGSFADLTPAEFRALVFHFSPTELCLTKGSESPLQLRANQISDEFLQALTMNRVRRVLFPDAEPMGGGSFSVTDDAIVNFCVQADEPVEQYDEDDGNPYAKLSVSNGTFSKDLFKRLVEAGAASTRTQSLYVRLEPVRFEEEDLRDFMQHLSYRNRRTRWEVRVYDFRGEPRGEGAAMDLQITLERSPRWTGDRLQMIRARRPNPYFESSDEDFLPALCQ